MNRGPPDSLWAILLEPLKALGRFFLAVYVYTPFFFAFPFICNFTIQLWSLAAFLSR